MSVTIVWMPMVEGDNLRRAQRAARMFRDGRVRQFYDPNRLLGRACMKDVFPDCLREVLQATPKDHPLYEMLQERAASGEEPPPLWDAVLFYGCDAQWNERVPAPARWSKQVGFHGSAAPGGPSAYFFRNDCHSPPVDSDWYLEVSAGFRAVMDEPR